MNYSKAIYYAPEGRGLRIGSAWIQTDEITLYGWYAGYEGGGCYAESWFKAIFDIDGDIINLFVFTGDPYENDHWDRCLIDGTNCDENPIFTHEEYEICDKARDQIMPEFIYFDDDSDRFIIDNVKLEELDTDGEHYFVIEIEEPKQKYMFDQIQNNWQLMSKLNLDVD